jgi:hypothetical protein
MTNADGSDFGNTEAENIEKDKRYSPGSDTDTERLQDDPAGSPAFDDPDIDESAVKVLPGTGGPDDEGDIELPENFHEKA